jgi:hypothetical protein
MAKYNYRRDDLWECTCCGNEFGRHDQYFDGKCEKCNEEQGEQKKKNKKKNPVTKRK